MIMSNLLMTNEALLPCSSQFFPAGGELPFSSPRTDSRRISTADEPALAALVAQVRQLPAVSSAADLGLAAQQPAAQQQLRRSISHGSVCSTHTYSQDLLPLQLKVQHHLAALQAGAQARSLDSLPSDSQQLSVGGAAIAHVFGSRASELGVRESMAGGAKQQPFQLHPLLEEQLQPDSQPQSPTAKQLSVMLLPGVSCNESNAAEGSRTAKSAPNSPEGRAKFSRSSSAAVRSSVAAEVRRFETLSEATRSSKDLIPAYPSLTVGIHPGSERKTSLPQHKQQQQCTSCDDAGKSEGPNWLSQLPSKPASSPRAIYAELQQLQGEVARLTAANHELEDLLHATRSNLSEAHMQLADRQEQLKVTRGGLTDCQEQLRATQRSLNEAQDELVEARASLAECQADLNQLRPELEVAEKARAELSEQLAHMTAKVQQQEDQLEFAHQQLDARQQELRANSDAASSARAAAEQLQEQLQSLKDELNATRRELDSVTRQLTSEANDAKRAGDEATALKRDFAQLQTDLNRSRQELFEAKERVRQLQGEAERRAAQLEGQGAELAQLLTVEKSRAAALQSQIDRLRDQLVSAEGDNSTLRSDLASLLASRQEAASAKEKLRQLQMESGRRIAELEADSSELSQQLMFMRSQHERLTQQLHTAEGNNAALSAELENAHMAASAANKSIQDAQMQQQRMQQQHQLQLQQAQQHAQQQLQQLQEKMQQHIERMQQQQQSQLRQMQMQQQMDRATAAAQLQYAAPAVSHSFDLMSTYPGTQPPVTLASRSSNRYSLDDELRTSMALLSSSPQYQQPALNSTYPGTRSVQPVAAYRGSSGSPDPLGLQAEGSAYWGAAAGAGSPDGKQSQQLAGSPVRSSRGSGGDSQPWFAGGPRPGSVGPPSGNRGAPQQQQQQQQQGAGASVNRCVTFQQAPSAAVQQAAGGSSYGTGMTAHEVMTQTKQLEDQLMALCQEKDELNREYSKMPLGSGKTIRERQRKAAVEARLDELDGLISKTRMALKRMLGR